MLNAGAGVESKMIQFSTMQIIALSFHLRTMPALVVLAYVMFFIFHLFYFHSNF
jgi:hypothetical protein